MSQNSRKFVVRSNAVESLESRQLLSALPWSPYAKLIGQDQAATNYASLTGAGMSVAVIDTGVDYRHSALGNGFGAGKKVIAGWDFVDNDADPFSDTNGHGTGAAGVISANGYTVNGVYNQGIAPGASIIALRENGTTGVKAALDWVYANRTKYNIVAVNLTDFGGGSALMYQDVMIKLIKAGVFVSHPAGNLGAKVNVPPSFDPADVSVGSVNPSGSISTFSQRGAECDLMAPGEDVTIPYYDPATKRHYYRTTWGTSWASPAVVGAAVLIKQVDPRFTPVQILKIMQDSGVPTYDAATKLTYKRLNLNAALALAYQRRTGVATPTPPMGNGPTSRSPFSGTPIVLGTDTTIQSENFDLGADGVAYHDNEAANIGGSKYRNGTGVDIQEPAANARHVAFVKAGEWLEYTINVPAAGMYAMSFRVASMRPGGTFHVEIDGVNKSGAISIPSTGNWGNWTTIGIKSAISISAGNHIVRIKADSISTRTGYTGNFDSFRFTQQVKTPALQPATTTVNAPFFSAASGVVKMDGFIGYLDQGDWAAYKGIDFGSGTTTFTAAVGAAPGWSGKKIQVRLGSATGTVVGTLTVPNTGGWTKFQAVTIKTTRITGVQDVYLTFAGGGAVGNVRWFKFA